MFIHQLQEFPEEPFRILGTSAGLRMELYRIRGRIRVAHALAGPVIHVDKRLLRACWQGVREDLITMVLTGNIDTACFQILDRLIGKAGTD